MMKKILTFAAMTAAVMMSFSACEKTGGENNGDNNGGNNDGGNNGPDETPEYVSPITIDGNFSDWDALDASTISECTGSSESLHTALTYAKVYADNMYINVYLEFDMSKLNTAYTPVHIYFNSDGNSATGGYGDEFLDPCIDCMLENSIFEEGAEVSFDPALFKWWGENGASGWLWTDPDIVADSSNSWGAILANGSGIAKGKGNGNGKYEIQIIKEMVMGFPFADTFSIGFDIQADWTSVGVLPNAPIDSETNPNGLANTMTVTVNK